MANTKYYNRFNFDLDASTFEIYITIMWTRDYLPNDI